MRQTQLHLTEQDRAVVEEIRSKGMHHAREVNRAHVLSSLDLGLRNINQRWTIPIQNWKQAMSQFVIRYGQQFTPRKMDKHKIWDSLGTDHSVFRLSTGDPSRHLHH